MLSKAMEIFKRFDLRRRYFARCFETPDGQKVLAYMKKRCMRTGTPFSNDPYLTAKQCGMQEAFQIMIQFTNMTDEQVSKLKEDNNA